MSIRYLITERKIGEQELKKAYTLLENSNEAALIGTWEFDVQPIHLTWSKVTRQIHEVNRVYQPVVENALAFYKEGESRDTITRLFTACLEKGEKFDIELQIVTAKGNEKWVRSIGIPVMENGECIRCYGTFQDIDEKKKNHLEIQKLSLVASKTHNGVVITDTNGCITWVNDAFHKITGFKLKEILGKAPGSFLEGAETNPAHSQKIMEALKRKKSINQEILNYTKKGVPFWNDISVTPITDDQGQVVQFVGILNDITERKLTEIALQESEERIKSIANSLPGAVLVYKQNSDGTEELLFLSDQCESIWEIKKEVLLTDIRIMWATVLEVDVPKVIASLEKSLSEESLMEAEWRIQTKSGKIKWLSGRGMPQKQADGSTIWVSFNLDITDRKTAEESLIKTYDLLEKSNETARIGTWEVDLNSMHLTWSKVTKEIYEVEPDYQPVADEALSFYKEGESRDTMTHLFNACVEKGEKFDVELQFITAKGNEKWGRAVGIPVMENGICVRVYGLIKDIDVKTKAIKQLGLQEEQFRKTFENAPNGIALLDLEGNWFKMNKSFCTILGYSEEELLVLSFLDITHPEEKKNNGALFKEMLVSKQESFQTEKRYIHKNGSIVWATVSLSAVKNDLGKIIHFVYQIDDITQMKMSQLLLQKHIKRLQGILDASTQVGIIEADLKGKIKIFNKGAENLLGYTAEEVVNKVTPEIFLEKENIHGFFQGMSEEYPSRNGNFEILEKLLEKGTFPSRDWAFVRKNGTTFPGLLSVTPILNADNEISGSLGMITDLTEMKRAEREIKSLLDVTQAQNNRLLNFAHIVSHNLRSHSANLAMILDLMQLEDTVSNDDYFFPLLKEASDHLKETIVHLNDVVVMNTTTQENLTNQNLTDFVDKSIVNVKALAIEAECIIQNKVQKNTKVQAIPAYLESTILNLLTNAIKYRSPKRKPVIILTSEIKGDYVLLKVKDNGLGIDLKLHGAKLFGMYKTFHGNEDARGIGLFITKNQVEAMGGSIEIESEVNKGTTFKINLLYGKD